MDTTMRKAVDFKKKKIWVRPFLTRLEVGETAAKPNGCSNDKDYPGTTLCGPKS